METIHRTRTQIALAIGTGLFLLGTVAIGIAGPKRIVRSCLSAWAGAVAEWRGGSEGRGFRDAAPEMCDRMDALTRELDRLRQEVRPGATTPSPARMQAEILELKAEVARLQQLVDRHEQGMQIVGETLDEMARCRQSAREARK